MVHIQILYLDPLIVFATLAHLARTAACVHYAKLANIKIEFDVLTRARDEAIPTSEKLDQLTIELRKINEALWDIEDDIRDCERAKDFSENFIKLARAVYFTNDKRMGVKHAINELLGSQLIEEKSYAAY